jgi:hypothetical protein
MSIRLSTKQKEALENPKRSAIHDFLQNYDKPASLGEVGEGTEISSLAMAFYHLGELIRVKLVEKVPGTEPYRVVEP